MNTGPVLTADTEEYPLLTEFYIIVLTAGGGGIASANIDILCICSDSWWGGIASANIDILSIYAESWWGWDSLEKDSCPSLWLSGKHQFAL